MALSSLPDEIKDAFAKIVDTQVMPDLGYSTKNISEGRISKGIVKEGMKLEVEGKICFRFLLNCHLEAYRPKIDFNQ